MIRETMAQDTMTHREVRSFHVTIPKEALVDLRRRIAATRWPDQETIADQSQGVQSAKLQELVQNWGNGRRQAEAKLNALPPRGRQGRSFRGLGAAGTVLRRAPRGIQITALGGERGTAGTMCARRPTSRLRGK